MINLFGLDYRVDSKHSFVGFKVRFMITGQVRGKFLQYAGIFSYDKDKNQLSSLVGTIDVSSIITNNDARDEHLLSSDFFNIKKYPYMNFVLVGGDEKIAQIQVTIKDVTQVIEMKILEVKEYKAKSGEKGISFTIKAALSRKRFHINFNPLLDAGGLLISDKIVLNIKLKGIEK